jgi:hypothetical protein
VVGESSSDVLQFKKQEPIAVESNVELWRKRLKEILYAALVVAMPCCRLNS